MAATPAWLAAVEALLNRGIQSSPDAKVLTRRLEATALRIDVTDVISIQVAVLKGRLLLESPPPADPAAPDTANATIAGSIAALLRLSGAGAGRDSSGTAAQVRGDAEIANLYRQLLSAAKPDWEEELARRVGDLAARRLARFGAAALTWVRRTRATAADNVAEYLQEESRLLVTRTELDEFLNGVDEIRDTAARVEARLRGLEQHLKDTR